MRAFKLSILALAFAAGILFNPAESLAKKHDVEAVDGVALHVPTHSPVKFDAKLIRGNAHEWQINYQAAATPVMEQFTWFHNYLLWIIIAITIVVLILLIYVCVRFRSKANPNPATFTHNAKVEFIWTVIPIIILVAIAIPSLRIHYNYANNQDVINNADVTIKVKGNQWYWSYEYPDNGVAFDSYMKKDADLLPGEPRLLAVDNPIVVPVNKTVRLQLTGADVIHSWAMPAFGVKQDTVPGRLNETWFKATKEGIYYGQCSELCGKYHGFMPIEVHVVSEKIYQKWLRYAKHKFADAKIMQFASLQ